MSNHSDGRQAGQDSLREETGEGAEFARRLGATLREGDRQALAMEGRLVERLLQATRAALPQEATGQDPSWRGDLRLIRGYLGERLAHSPLLRLAAASLLVHLIAVPAVLAYVYLEKRAPEVMLGFERAPDPEPFEADLPAEPEVMEALDLDGLAPLAAANAMAWDRVQLTEALDSGQVPETGQGTGASATVPVIPGTLLAWLSLRAEQITRGAAIPSLLSDTALEGREGELLRVVAIETWLDAMALGGSTAPDLRQALASLARVEPAGAAGQRLAARALARAAAYGLPVEPSSAGLGAEERRLGPLEQDWAGDLRAAAEAAGLPGARDLWTSER